MSFLRARLVDPVLAQLKQGATPEGLAWSLALGVWLGTFPALGTTTLLCGLAGVAFRLNHVVLQAANYLAYPLQLVLLLPLLALGGRLLDAPVPSSLDALQAELARGVLATVAHFAKATLGAALIWLAAGGPVALAARVLLARAIRARRPPQ